MAKKSEHARCIHASGPVIMQRVYVREGYAFKPMGWLCPDCHQFKHD